MLRRKFLIIFGSLVALLVCLAVTALWLLQRTLVKLDHVNTESAEIVEQVNRLDNTVAAVEIDLYQLQLSRTSHLDSLIDHVEALRALAEDVSGQYMVGELGAGELVAAMRAHLPVFEGRISSLATAADPALARQYKAEALAEAMRLHETIRKIERLARAHARAEQTELAVQFRRLVLGLAIGCLAVINLTIIFLLRSAAMVLGPVGKLVAACRQLEAERFDHRVHLDGKDEFHELAQAYNHLAHRLAENEQRKMEMLGQVAVTLNHEVNNAAATIELQLSLMGRQAGADAAFSKCLRQIQDSLERMAKTVEALKHVRRIVLTDYVDGVKMLDLQQSVMQEPHD